MALRAFEKACVELNLAHKITEQEKKRRKEKLNNSPDWYGYADDLPDFATDLNEATTELHQLEAACAFVGLFINAEKTECITNGIKKPEVDINYRMRERIAIKVKDKWQQMWLVDWNEETDKTENKLRLENFPSHKLVTLEHYEISILQEQNGSWTALGRNIGSAD